jgi:two-component system phosphate regulon response regulator PhoB
VYLFYEQASGMESRIFIVEDDVDIARLVRHHLETAGFSTRVFSRISTVLAEAQRETPALFILDIMVPGGDGLELCRQIRQSKFLAATPIIFLTAKSAEADRITGLDIGGDDYITKPFSPRELVARVKAVLRRFEQPLDKTQITAGTIEIDTNAMIVTVRGTPVITTATEFRLLEHLARHQGKVFTRGHLLDAVWRDTHFVSERSVDVYIRKLREKVEAEPDMPLYIKTVRGVGYRFEVPKNL